MAKLIKAAETILSRLKKGEEVEVKSYDEARKISKSLRNNSISAIAYEKLPDKGQSWTPYVLLSIEPKPLTPKEIKAIEAGTVKAPKKKVPQKRPERVKSAPKLSPTEARRAAALEKAKALF